MATTPLHSLISNNPQEREKLDGSIPAVSASLHIQPLPQTRYESDEEEESELDIPAARDDRFFSTPDAESDIAIGSQMTTDHCEGGFEFTMSPSELQRMPDRRQGTDTPQRTSVYTIRRISGLTLLPPLQTSTEQLQQRRDASRSRSPSVTPRTRAERPATMIFEAEEVDSIYSDPPSDYDDTCNDSEPGEDNDAPDGGAIDELFFVATPITYHLPKGRPSLVSISPPPSQSGRSPQIPSQPEEQSPRAQKKQKKRDSASLERTDSVVSRHSSTSSSNINKNLLHIKVSRNEPRRGSTYISPAPSPALSATSPMLAMTPPDSAKFFTEPKKHKQAPSESRRRSLIPGQLRGGRRDRNASVQTPPPTDFEPQNAKNQPLIQLNQGHRRRATDKPPSFNNVAWRPASPPTSPSEYSTTSLNSPLPVPQKWPFNRQQSSVSEPPPSPGPLRKSNTFQVPVPSHLDQMPVPRSRARTRSISSIASNASKFSIPAFDSASLKAIAKKYQNRAVSPLPGTTSPTPSSSSNLRPTAPESPRRPSDCGSTMSERPNLPPRHQFLRAMSTTNLSMLTSAHDTIDEDGIGSPYQSKSYNNSLGRKSKRYSSTSKTSVSTSRSSVSNPQHIRSKSIKWLQGTGESMTLAGSKLGSMLRKKSVAMPTIS
ncbi:uncharacterized protein GIQ15_05395 [Arthroderma uncinatum]|uniref:uncharacterized protein n=1 Tax=Arthroderma uncinatum TaxID=74035 RepID=UPI00144A6711|nr:uncharacterized protein GIQ15_05395 [Arthroderma uncinatum]KAF3480048.1 hypothetical protein GIQ15_05395 [Arthroderma uncinatum]